MYKMSLLPQTDMITIYLFQDAADTTEPLAKYFMQLWLLCANFALLNKEKCLCSSSLINFKEILRPFLMEFCRHKCMNDEFFVKT